jgi:hypothetical protein
MATHPAVVLGTVLYPRATPALVSLVDVRLNPGCGRLRYAMLVSDEVASELRSILVGRLLDSIGSLKHDASNTEWCGADGAYLVRSEQRSEQIHVSGAWKMARGAGVSLRHFKFAYLDQVRSFWASTLSETAAMASAVSIRREKRVSPDVRGSFLSTMPTLVNPILLSSRPRQSSQGQSIPIRRRGWHAAPTRQPSGGQFVGAVCRSDAPAGSPPQDALPVSGVSRTEVLAQI